MSNKYSFEISSDKCSIEINDCFFKPMEWSDEDKARWNRWRARQMEKRPDRNLPEKPWPQK